MSGYTPTKKITPASIRTTCNTRSLFMVPSGPARIQQLIASSQFVVELQRHGAVRGCSSRSQGSSNHRAFCDFLARRAGGLRALYVHFDAVRALGRERHTQCDQLAIFSRNGSVLAADDIIEA